MVLLMEASGDHPLRLVVYPIIYSFFKNSDGGWQNGISEPSNRISIFSF